MHRDSELSWLLNTEVLLHVTTLRQYRLIDGNQHGMQNDPLREQDEKSASVNCQQR